MPTWENQGLFSLYASPNLKRPVLCFWQTSEKLKQSNHILYLLTTKCHCAETGHGYHNTNQSWSDYNIVLHSYILTALDYQIVIVISSQNMTIKFVCHILINLKI